MTTAGDATFRVGLIQMRSGRTPAANVDAAVALIAEAKAAGADYVQTPEMTNILEARRDALMAAILPEREDPSLAGIPRGGAGAPAVAPYRFARPKSVPRPRRQPRLPDRSARRDHGPLR